MLYELRRYDVAPTKLPALLDRFGSFTVHKWKEYGFRLIGFWTPVFASLLFVMALNFQFASGNLLKYAFLTSGYGLPVLGSTLALAIGGVKLRISHK